MIWGIRDVLGGWNERAWGKYGTCLGDIRDVRGGNTGRTWGIYGAYLGEIRDVLGGYTGAPSAQREGRAGRLSALKTEADRPKAAR